MDFDGIELLFSKVELGVASDLKILSKKIKNKTDSAIIFLFTEIDKKITISVAITDDLIAKSFHAGELVKFLASELKSNISIEIRSKFLLVIYISCMYE